MTPNPKLFDANDDEIFMCDPKPKTDGFISHTVMCNQEVVVINLSFQVQDGQPRRGAAG